VKNIKEKKYYVSKKINFSSNELEQKKKAEIEVIMARKNFKKYQ
jgi:hypothetical protein